MIAGLNMIRLHCINQIPDCSLHRLHSRMCRLSLAWRLEVLKPGPLLPATAHNDASHGVPCDARNRITHSYPETHVFDRLAVNEGKGGPGKLQYSTLYSFILKNRVPLFRRRHPDRSCIGARCSNLNRTTASVRKSIGIATFIATRTSLRHAFVR